MPAMPAMLAMLAMLALFAAAPARAATPVTLQGSVTDEKTGKPVEKALVILQCSCLQGPIETVTNTAGLYNFSELPPGTYTVQVLFGQANVSVSFPAEGGVTRRDFRVDPANRFVLHHTIEVPVRQGGASRTLIKPDELRHAGTGGTNRDLTGVIDVAPTVTADAGGLRLGGTTSAETRYTLDNANITTPAFGTLSATIVQEFIDEVEVLEAGYDAEYGGASGGQVRARRVGGSNKLRGVLLMRVAPRLATPRLVAATDESLRVAEIAEVDAQGVFQISGPIVRDRLFFAIGVAPGGQSNSMIQSFYRRRDKDRSGGYESCAYENGTADCAAGGNYIDSVKFAEQKFRTGRFDLQWSGTLDWQVTPKHRMRLSGGSSPISFRRTSFRLPPGSEPSAFGTNPLQTLGGQSRVGQGVINDTFGSKVATATGAGLDYEGRVAGDRVEIYATVFYSRFRSVDAWRLDDPNLKNVPLVQRTDTQGRNLYDLLDRDGAIRLVPGVDAACNNSGLPGLSRFRQTTAYSGTNTADFYANCPAGQRGGGEYCYDPATDSYAIGTGAGRVDNHRSVTIDADNPDIRTSIGYGRVRAEQNDLRAIASPTGAGVRVPTYDATLTTTSRSWSATASARCSTTARASPRSTAFIPSTCAAPVA